MSSNECESVFKELVRGIHNLPNDHTTETPSSAQLQQLNNTINSSEHKKLKDTNLGSSQHSLNNENSLQIHNDHGTDHHHSNHSLNINAMPALVVTGTSSSNDTGGDSNSNRRFSQFYLGLRRFSNSYTVDKLFIFILVFDRLFFLSLANNKNCSNLVKQIFF